MNTLTELFAYKAWANQELLAELAKVDAAAHADALKDALRLLNHTHVVDQIFAAHLQGQPHGFGRANTDATPTVAELTDAMARVDAWLQSYASSLTPQHLAEEVLFTFTDGDPGRMRREQILLHLITHGSYHRGQVGEVLNNMGGKPPRDLFTRFLRVAG